MNLDLLCLIHSERLEKCQAEPCRGLMVPRDQLQWGDLEPRSAQSSSTLSLLHLVQPTHRGSLGDVLRVLRRDIPEMLSLRDQTCPTPAPRNASESLPGWNYIKVLETKQKPSGGKPLKAKLSFFRIRWSKKIENDTTFNILNIPLNFIFS